MNWVEFQKSNTAQVRIGEIGMSFGIHHAQIAAAAPDAQLVAACDVRDSQRAAVEQLGAHFYSDFRQMLNAEPLDGMVVAVPIHLHAEVSIACLEHGLPVLLEKPLASTLEDADRIIEATNRYGVPLLVGHQRRFSPFCELARETIANRDLGDLVGVSVLWTILKPQDYYSAHWRTRRETGGGPLLINAIHTIDDLRYITQLEVTRVYAETSNRTRGLEVEDTASILLYLQGGTLATIFLSDCTPSIWSYEATTAPWENPFFHYSPADCYHFFGKGCADITANAIRALCQFSKTRVAISNSNRSSRRSANESIALGDEPFLSGDPGRRTTPNDCHGCSTYVGNCTRGYRCERFPKAGCSSVLGRQPIADGPA